VLAIEADEMMVPVVPEKFEPAETIADVDLAQQSHIPKVLERAVNGRSIHKRH